MGAIAVLRVPRERLYLFKRSQIYVYKGLKGNLFALKSLLVIDNSGYSENFHTNVSNIIKSQN